MAFLNNINDTKVNVLYEKILKLDNAKQKCYVTSSDAKAGKDFIEQMPESSLYSAKMANAIAIRKYLKDTNSKKKIKDVYWTYRAKPAGVPANSPADIVIFFNDGSILAVKNLGYGKPHVWTVHQDDCSIKKSIIEIQEFFES